MEKEITLLAKFSFAHLEMLRFLYNCIIIGNIHNIAELQIEIFDFIGCEWFLTSAGVIFIHYHKITCLNCFA
jgi:Na+/alanine symporter